MNSIRIYKVMVVVLILGIASICSAKEGTWKKKSDMPTARFCLSTSVVDGKVYAIGGTRILDGPYFSTVEVYDPTTDTWTRKADMPTARMGHAAAVVNGKIYVIGGCPSRGIAISKVEEYDPSTDTWRSRADLPVSRAFHCVCALDGKIYIFAGFANGEPGPDRHPGAMVVYDPSTDTWTPKTDIAMPTAGVAAAVVEGKIYVMGGVNNDLHNTPIAAVQVYDPTTDTWTRKTNMPTARMFLSCITVGGKIYAIGGGIWNSTIYPTLEMYDPAMDTWTTEPDMPTARYMHASSAVNGEIFIIGGLTGWYPTPGISIVEAYELAPPPLDFNGDGMVDIKDLLRLIGSWNQDDSLLDIAPPPFGDGIVDALDLELLMSYWKQPVDDPTLLAHWSLDETEGIIAYDSAGVNDAVVVGGTEWQPSGGQIDGALHLDGIDGYALTSPILNPAEGPFSVFAWINGGAPGQAILSQLNGVNWLRADPDLGCLMTELTPPAVGRSVPQPLISECFITDGQWHRIGFVWDGINRALYVDDILVAEDTQNNLASSLGGLNIGCGSNYETETFWSGLIDDVRIYNRAVRP